MLTLNSLHYFLWPRQICAYVHAQKCKKCTSQVSLYFGSGAYLLYNGKYDSCLLQILPVTFLDSFPPIEYGTYRGRVEIWGLYLPSQLERTVHHNFVRDGRYSERGWACIPHPHQPGLIFPSWWNVRQKWSLPLCVYRYSVIPPTY